MFYKPGVLNPLSVSVQPKKEKKMSTLDFRYANRFIKRLWIKYDDWKIALLTFQKNGYMFSFDVKSGYHLCQDLPTASDILGFSWDFQGETRFYIFSLSFWPFCRPIFTRYSAPWSDGGELTAYASWSFWTMVGP